MIVLALFLVHSAYFLVFFIMFINISTSLIFTAPPFESHIRA